MSSTKITDQSNKTNLAKIPTESKNKKRIREQLSNEQFKAKRVKIVNGSHHLTDHSLLHLYVEYAWEVPYGKCTMDHTMQLVNWIFSENIDFNSKDWHSSISTDNAISAKLAFTLRFVLPILIKSNGDVKYTDAHGQTVLHVFLKYYMWSQQPRMETDFKLHKLIASLITRGASVNAVDKFGNTPFSIAASGLRRDLCWTMLRYFDNVHVCDDKGDTVLHIIAGNRSLPNVWCDIVNTLLNKGADPNKRNNDGLTPVNLAAKCGKDRLLQIFAKYENTDFSLRTFKGETNLLLYCRNERHVELLVETVELLLSDDCDIDAMDEFGFSSLHYATRHEASAVVDRLGKFRIEKGGYNVDMSVTMFSASFTSNDDGLEDSLETSFDVTG